MRRSGSRFLDRERAFDRFQLIVRLALIEGITETEAAGILNVCRTVAIARTPQANHNS
jgi:hypothetical protein